MTQYFAHRQWNNPAAMGEEVQTTVAALGQYRLYGFDNAPMTAAVQATVPFNTGDAGGGARSVGSYYQNGKYSHTGTETGDDETKNMFIGVSLQGNRIGIHGNYDGVVSYTYQLLLRSSALAFGVSAGTKITTQNYHSLTNDYDEIDPLNNDNATQYAFTAQTGVYWHNSKFYASLYSPAILDKDIFLQSGYNVAFGADDDNNYESPAKKNQWEIHAQAGRLGTGEWMVQSATIFTLKGLLGIGAVWQYPTTLAALAALNIGNVKIGYAYQIYNLNEYLVQHEITIKIGFAKRKK